MAIRWESVRVDGRSMRTYVGVPNRPGPHPGIVIAQHASGVDAQIQDAVHRLFRAGYAVAAPELFHRQPVDADPKQRSGLLLDEEIIADLRATAEHLNNVAGGISRLGTVGFCMGGRASYLGASAIAEFKAAVVFYGGNLMKALGPGKSPLERSAGIQCPVLAFFGAEDVNPSPGDMHKVSSELTRLNKPHEFHVYQGAGHAFQNFADARYRERAARASWTEMLAFLTEHLKRGPG